MLFRSEAIIYKRSAANDESLSIDVLTAAGEKQGFKIPGILKSTKRSNFHFAPGAIYEFEWVARGDTRLIPKNSQLRYSPFEHTQEYAQLEAVAEIVQLVEFIQPGPESSEGYALLATALRALPAEILDPLYARFLALVGLSGERQVGEEYAAYDLAAGYLTAAELSRHPKSDFILPADWGGRAHRETIRRFLRG